MKVFGRFINWYVKSYWGDEYIHISKITDQIVTARQDEAKKWREQYEMDIEHALNLKEIEKRTELASAEAKIVQLEQHINDMRQLKKNVERAGMRNKTDAKKNFLVSNELKLMVNKLLETIAEMSGRFDNLSAKAQTQVDILEKKPNQIEENKK